MIEQARIHLLNADAVAAGRYVLYWMQASQRTEFNHALEYAAARANGLHQPLVVGFGLMDDYPEANARHYSFMLEGLRDVEAGLKARGIKFVVRRGSPEKAAVELATDASLVVCDRGYLRHQKRWRDHVADHAGRQVVEIESDVVVPVEAASDKHEFAARTLRPRIHKLWDQYLKPLRAHAAKKQSLHLDLAGDVDVTDPGAALATLKVDRSVPSARFKGGSVEAHRRLAAFVRGKLAGYHDGRNEPAAEHTSFMAAYLHFGQISPGEIAMKARDAAAPVDDRAAYLEELIVRRELSMNYCHFCPDYDQYRGLPDWARKTLDKHRGDPRPYVYTRQQLEEARTHDPYWNAAQQEMTSTGFMHNYMRMYWGKRILEWKRTPEEAFEETLYLNNKYFLCGRDANSFANVAWIFGLHDRPWGERPIFGMVRYMNAAGLERKFDMAAYVKRVSSQ